jgi:hypothetical protein
LATFGNVDHQHQFLGRRVVELHLVLGNFDVQETELPVVVAKLVEVILELVVLETA